MRTFVADWLVSYRREWLKGDLVAGLTTAAVVVPKVMAYGLIAGLTVEAGLYTALAAMLVYPLLGSSRLLVVSTSSALAMLTAAATASAAQTYGAEPIVVAGTLALTVSGVLLAGSLLKLGFLANYISLPVLIGFQAGVGILIIVGQLKALLGAQFESTTTLGLLLELPGVLPRAHLLTVLLAATSLILLVVLDRLFPRRPVPLLILGVSVAASAYFELDALGVRTVGAFPPGLPSFALPELSLVTTLWPAALGIALVAFAESITASRATRQPDEPRIDANRELLALGAMNSATAFVGGMPADGAISHTAIARQAGGRSQLAQWAAAGAVVATLLSLSPAIGALPEAALAAVIVFVSVGLLKPQRFAAIARVRRTELAWALVTVAGVVAAGVLTGIVLAVVVSMLTLIYQANRPPVYAVGYNREQRVFGPVEQNTANETFPGLLILRSEGRLVFSNVEHVGDKMRALVEQAKPRVVVLECSAILDIEYTALVLLAEAEQRLRDQGVAVWLAGVNAGLLPLLERSTVAAARDPARIFADLHHALEAWQRLEVPAETAADAKAP